jgi:hypothetical protein
MEATETTSARELDELGVEEKINQIVEQEQDLFTDAKPAGDRDMELDEEAVLDEEAEKLAAIEDKYDPDVPHELTSLDSPIRPSPMGRATKIIKKKGVTPPTAGTGTGGKQSPLQRGKGGKPMMEPSKDEDAEKKEVNMELFQTAEDTMSRDLGEDIGAQQAAAAAKKAKQQQGVAGGKKGAAAAKKAPSKK